MNIGINAMSAARNGTRTFLDHILPALEFRGRHHRWFIYGTAATLDRLRPRVSGAVFRPVKSRSTRLARFIEEQIRVPRLMRRDRIDLVFTPGAWDLFLAPRPRVVDVRTSDPFLETLGSRGFSATLSRKLDRWLAVRSLRSADRIVCASDFARRLVAERLPGWEAKTSTVPESAGDCPPPPLQLTNHGGSAKSGPHRAFSPSALPWMPAHFFFAAGEPGRNTDYRTVIRAYRICRNLGLTAPLLLPGWEPAGNGPEALTAEIQRLALGPYVDIVPDPDPATVAALMTNAEVFLYPGQLETHPATLLEAMRCAAAVVAADTPRNREVAGDAVTWCDDNSELDMAQAILKITANADYAASLRQQAARRAANDSWESTATSLIRLLEQTSASACPGA